MGEATESKIPPFPRSARALCPPQGRAKRVLGACNMAGKILTGLLVQYLTISPTILSAASIGLLGVGCIGFTFCSTYTQFAIVTATYGVMLSSMDVLTPLILIEIFGDGKLKESFGLVMVAKFIPIIWGPPIGGALKDWSGKYNFAFYASGTFQLMGSLLNMLVCLFHS